MKTFSHWPLKPASMIQRFQSWQKILALHEPGFVFFYPFTEHTYQMHYFLEWLKEKRQLAPRIITIYPTSEDIADFHLLDSDRKTGILIDGAEHLFTPDSERLLEELMTYASIHETAVIFFTELSPFTFQAYVSKFHKTGYSKHILTSPIHDKENTWHFLQFLEKLWSFHLPKSMWEPIYAETGGYLWLVKEIVRQVKSDKKTLAEIIRSPAYTWRMQELWKRFPADIRAAAISQYRTKTSEENALTAYLRDTRFFNKECANLLPHYIVRLIRAEEASKLEVRDAHIYVNGSDISSVLSSFERRMLTALISRKNQIVSRDELAKARWGDTWCDNYSDWAIDQAMYRIRNKLQKFDTSIQIHAERKKGYGIQW